MPFASVYDDTFVSYYLFVNCYFFFFLFPLGTPHMETKKALVKGTPRKNAQHATSVRNGEANQNWAALT